MSSNPIDISSNFYSQDEFEFNYGLTNDIFNNQPEEYSYFYELSNEIYHITCKEIIDRTLITSNDSIQYDNVYNFDYQQLDTKRLYRFACRKLSPTFIFQLLNKYIYGIHEMESTTEQQEVFLVEHQEILKDHIIKKFAHYLELKQFCTQEPLSDLRFMEDYQYYYTAGSNAVGLNGSSNEKENENSEKTSLPCTKCVWHEKPVKLLLSFLITRKEEVNQLATKRGGGGNIKTKLWDDAVVMLFRNGYYEYTAKQCATKWKNMKKEYSDNNIQIRYKSEVEEILGGNGLNLESRRMDGNSHFNDMPMSAKRKMLDEDKSNNKAVKFIYYENPKN